MYDDLKLFEHFDKLEKADREWYKLHSIEQEIQRRSKGPTKDLEELYEKEKEAKERLNEAMSELRGE